MHLEGKQKAQNWRNPFCAYISSLAAHRSNRNLPKLFPLRMYHTDCRYRAAFITAIVNGDDAI